jgi:branched-chain amino acid transport system substrate-binding protein
VLEALPTIHEQKILLLDPWAAADAITDNEFVPNYAFRLSMRDSWGIPVLLQEAERQHRHKIGLLLLNTSWGRSSLQAAEQHIVTRPPIHLVGTHWFNWDDRTFIAKYQALLQAGAQAIILVANANEASILLREMVQLPKEQHLPIYSHWGVSGGDLAGMAGPALQEVEFYVAQTFTFVNNTSPKVQHVLRAAQRLFHIAAPQYLPAQVGLAHAYDVTHLLARAIDQAGSTDRAAIREALEKMGSYDGLMKSYALPFTPTRHDALTAADVFVARYIHANALIPVHPR